MKKLLVLAAVIFMAVSSVSAQNYNWAIGARLGTTMSGVSVKHNLNGANAIEGVLSIPYNDGFNVLGLYERHIPIISEGFNFYYGAGAHLGAYRHDFVLGIDAVVGMEYKFSKVPLALSLDYKPAFNIFENTGFRMLDFGFGIKVAF